MAISTALDIIKGALRILGVLAQGEDASAQEANDALDKLNAMLGLWGIDSLKTTTTVEDSHTLTISIGSYTIGSGQTIDTAKPVRIVNAFLRDSNNNDYDVHIVTKDVYLSKPDKATATGRPTDLFYDPGVAQQSTQTGTIYLYPLPNAAYTLYIESEKEFTEFSSLTTSYTFPSSYKLAMMYKLALLLAPEYGVALTQDIKNVSRETIEKIERLNAINKMQIKKVDLPGTVHSDDIERG